MLYISNQSHVHSYKHMAACCQTSTALALFSSAGEETELDRMILMKHIKPELHRGHIRLGFQTLD